MTKIKRTPYANEPRAASWVASPMFGWDAATPFADTAFEQDYPSHSPVLGPDGQPLAYEAREPLGFNLRKRT